MAYIGNGIAVQIVEANNVGSSQVIDYTLTSSDLSNTGVTAGTYGNSSAVPVLTIDQAGRVTAAVTNTVAGVTALSWTTANNTLTVSTLVGSYTANLNTWSNPVTFSNTVAAGNTTITGFANVTSTIQGGSSLTIAGALSGVTTAAIGNTTVTGWVQAANGLYSQNTFSGTYTDGIVVDYTNGTGRISVGTNDGIAFYSNGIANQAMVTIASSGATTFANTVTVTGNATFSNTVSVAGNLTGSAANTTIVAGLYTTTFANNGTTTFPGAVSGITTMAAGNTTITGYANVSTTLQVAGAITGANTIAVTGNATFSNSVGITGPVDINNGVTIVDVWDANTGASSLYLNATTGNRIEWNQHGVGAPATQTRSVGTKLVLYPLVSSGQTGLVDFGVGVESGHMWFSAAGANDGFKWYANTTVILSANTTSINLNTRPLTGVTTLAVGNTTITGFANVSSTLNVVGATTLTDVTISGNLTASGTTTYINTTNLNIGDNLIVLNADLGATAPTEDAGIVVNRGSSANVQFNWDETNDRWSIGNTYITGSADVTTTLQVGTNTSTFGTAAYIVSNGHVGIHTAVPIAPLTISNSTTISANLITTDKFVIAYEGVAPGASIVTAGDVSGQRAVFKGVKSGGTLAAPTAPTANHEALSLLSALYDGNTTLATAAVNFIVDGSVSAGVAPQRISLMTGNTSSRVERMTIKSDGKVGIGNTTPADLLRVEGSFSAVTKSFLIDHPTQQGKTLRYASLEGPENGVYVRGRLTNTSIIALPEYWSKLVDSDTITVNITPIGSNQDIYVMEANNTMVVLGGALVDCYYTVYGERCDVSKLVVEE